MSGSWPGCEAIFEGPVVTIRFDPNVLEGLRATGRGWQRLVNDTMRKRLKEMAS